MLCGIDEAGRGPLAGPLVIAGVMLPGAIEGLADSKKLSEKKREQLFEKITRESLYHIAVFSASDIDLFGLSACLKKGLEAIKQQLNASSFLFDGNTTFGVEGLETLVKADDQIEEVMAASVLAKVTRDRIMIHEAKNYPLYGFESHKGYGTKAHIEAIRKHGYSDIHRKSFTLKGLEASLFQ